MYEYLDFGMLFKSRIVVLQKNATSKAFLSVTVSCCSILSNILSSKDHNKLVNCRITNIHVSNRRTNRRWMEHLKSSTTTVLARSLSLQKVIQIMNS